MSFRKSNYKDIEKFRLVRNKGKRKYFSKTAKYKRRAWTELEDVIVLEHKKTDTEISNYIQRSVCSIQTRRSRLKEIENNNNVQ
jgi:iron uptake system EfeUOB component EfeO/EfeM